MATRKLDKQDLDQLTELQSKFQPLMSSIASNAIDFELATEQLELIKGEKTMLIEQFKELRKNENDLLTALKEKYGEGEINLTDGTFISND